MKNVLWMGALLLVSFSLHAKEMSYTNVSKYMLNNNYVQSPVYTKKMLRSIREKDTYNYQTQLAQLDKLKENRQISTKEYNEKKSQLEQEYNKIYSQFNPQAQAATIKKSPVESFYYSAMKPGSRLTLMALSTQELTNTQHSVPPAQIQAAQERAQINVNSTPKNRRSTENIAISQADTDVEPAIENYTQPPRQISVPKKRALGQKAIPVKIGAF